MSKSKKNRITVDIVRNLADLKEVFKLRRESFVKEKDIPEEMEFDGNDFSCTHLLMRFNDKPAGTLRIRYFKDFPKIERLCIAKKYRGYGLSKYLLDYTEEYLAEDLNPEEDYYLDEDGEPVFYINPGIAAPQECGLLTFPLTLEEIDDEL